MLHGAVPTPVPNTILLSMNGIPARKAAASVHPTHAVNICSLIILPVTLHLSTFASFFDEDNNAF